MTAIIKLSSIIVDQSTNIESFLLVFPILMLSVFWIFFWRQGLKKRVDVSIFLNMGLFGIITFTKEIKKLYRHNLIGEEIESFSDFANIFLLLTGSITFFVSIAGTWSLVGWWLVFWIMISFLAASFSLMIIANFSKKSIYDTFGMILLLVSGLILAFRSRWSLAIIVGFLSGLGLDLWIRAEKKQDWFKYLAILALPWFCTFPIVFIFSTLAMHDFLSWQWPQILLAWIIIFGTCTALWQRGQKLDHDARNPLYGILDKQ
jgi:hypothetical protein